MIIFEMILLIFLTISMAEASDWEWKPVCEASHNGPKGYVRGDIVMQYSDEDTTTVVMDNLKRNVSVKCSDPRGDPRIFVGDKDLTPTPPPYEDNADNMPPNTSRPSVREVLWQKNFTTFWKSEKNINCKSGKSSPVRYTETELRGETETEIESSGPSCENGLP